MKRIKRLPWPMRWAVVLLLAGWRRTVAVTVHDPHGELQGAGGPRLYVLWHNRLLLLPVIVPRQRRAEVRYLASRSRDGGYIADVLETLGMRAVRGSSSKGGATALRQMRQVLAAGSSVALTPDGPRGPRYTVQDGVLWLAAQTGCAIVPLAINAPHHWEARNWDRTQFPRPCSRVELRFGEPLTVTGLTEANLPEWRARVREAMLAICRYDHPEPGD